MLGFYLPRESPGGASRSSSVPGKGITVMNPGTLVRSTFETVCYGVVLEDDGYGLFKIFWNDSKISWILGTDLEVVQ
jgi:hypothetical protein